ncbi:MAG: hypothetical protein EPO16_09980 [Dehalococcoidia bacterium]|nr:MAG: hypothetical protein EPO16_09980 [Dehalococcoidia bacterium]
MSTGEGLMAPPARQRLPLLGRMSSTAWIFVGLVGVTLSAWLALAYLFSGMGGGTSVVETQRVIKSLSSTTAKHGALEFRAVAVTPDYFRVTDRGDELFALDPKKNLATMVDSPEYFDTFNKSSADLGVDPERYLSLLVTVAVHEGDLPATESWLESIVLRSGDVGVAPLPAHKVAYRSEHHVTLALQFPRKDENGVALLKEEGQLRLVAPGFAPDQEPLAVSWQLPLADTSDAGAIGAGATMGGMLAVFAGLLVIFSPCAVHMTAYFLPMITGLGMKEVLDRTDDIRFRARLMSLALAFVGGFVVLYTLFGVAAGFAGQFFSDTARLAPYVTPLRIFAGTVVIFMAMQTLGVFRLPFVLNLAIPGRPHAAGARAGYFAAVVSGMTVSMGCLTCVGGSLLAALLIYAGASGSPMTGGLTLFLFSCGMSIPFLVAAFAFQRAVPKFTGARRLLRYSTTAAAALMLVMGLLIISGNDSIFERLVL